MNLRVHGQGFDSTPSKRRRRCLPVLATCLALASVAGNALADDSGEVPAATAMSVMAEVLQSRGLTPPANSGLSMGDYIESNAGQAGERRVWVSIGPEGNIIPGAEWRDGHKEYCKQRARETLEPAQRIRFKLNRLTETDAGKTRYQYFVFGGVIDTATGSINHQQEWESSVMQDIGATSGVRENPDADALFALMSEAMDGMPLKPRAMVGPCGEIRLEHVSGSQVGEPIVFQAGFQGSYGRYLNYTWDFGDGSAPEDIGKRAQHVYARNGTYPVTVTVEGKDVEPSSKTLEVVIGGSLALHFSSRIEMRAPGDTRIVSKFESVVPLSISADGTFQGSAPLRNVEMSNSAADRMVTALGCTVTPRDGVLEARATLPDVSGKTAGGTEVSVTIPHDRSRPIQEAVPGADVRCPNLEGNPVGPLMRQAVAGIGATWWTSFVASHEREVQADGSFHFSEWEATDDPGVIARKVYRNTLTLEGPSSVNEVTTLEIRGGSGTTAPDDTAAM